MAYLNRFQLMGNVASKHVYDNAVKITIATERAPTEGRQGKATDFIQITLLSEKQRIWAADHVGRGARVYAEGRIQSTSFQQNGETRYGTDFVASIFVLMAAKDVEVE